jgi:hypothetical protein
MQAGRRLKVTAAASALLKGDPMETVFNIIVGLAILGLGYLAFVPAKPDDLPNDWP